MVPHWVKAVVASVPAILVALWTWRHLTSAIGPFFEPIQKSCEAQVEGVENPFLKIYSTFNCILVPFFKFSFDKDEGVFIWINFASLGAVFGGFVATEASRLGTRFPLYLTIVYMSVFVLIGVSIGFPLLWLPSYFLLGMPQSFASSSSLTISTLRVWLNWSINTIVLLTQIAPLFPWQLQSDLELSIKVMVWLPVGVPLLAYLAPVFKTSNPQAGQKAVISMHSFNTGIAVAGHMVGVLFALSHSSVVPKLLDLLRNHEGTDASNYFLLIDIFVLWGALVHQVLVEGGLVPALLVVLGTPVMGLGGPLGLYYMYRESLIFTHHKGGPAADSGKQRKKRKDA